MISKNATDHFFESMPDVLLNPYFFRLLEFIISQKCNRLHCCFLVNWITMLLIGQFFESMPDVLLNPSFSTRLVCISQKCSSIFSWWTTSGTWLLLYLSTFFALHFTWIFKWTLQDTSLRCYTVIWTFKYICSSTNLSFA